MSAKRRLSKTVERKMSVHPIEFRYGTIEMKAIWNEERKLHYLLRVEVALS
jgi:adenylosuccinate lyase